MSYIRTCRTNKIMVNYYYLQFSSRNKKGIHLKYEASIFLAKFFSAKPFKMTRCKTRCHSTRCQWTSPFVSSKILKNVTIVCCISVNCTVLKLRFAVKWPINLNLSYTQHNFKSRNSIFFKLYGLKALNI